MADKFEEVAVVVEQKSLGNGIFDMTLKTKQIAKAAKAGQFVSVYSDDKSKLLPRPISLCGYDKEEGTIRLVYRVTGPETGTDEFSKKKAGDSLRILGPLGNGFDIIPGKSAFLIGGGIGVPPMLQLAKDINSGAQPQVDFQVVMGYRNSDTFLFEEFLEEGHAFMSTEDGSLGAKGNVLNAIEENNLKADVIYACGPTPMLRALTEYAQAHDMECYISMEERMACGIGACLACVCKTKDKDSHSNVNNKRICKDGPVFNAKEVEL